MKKILTTIVLFMFVIVPVGLFAAEAAASTATNAAPPAATLEQRVAGLEAYIANGDPSAAVPALKDKGGNLPKDFSMATLQASGPGHNAWQMASAALVLFMTLPGLALFYGGLVRRKNVLSVCAQCFFITGLVTILWWICGYSFVFADVNGPGGDSSTILGSFTKHAFLKDVDSTP